MTYCLGMCLDAGLVMVADSRTNAGVDHVASFRKLRVWEVPGERVMILLSAGNLAVTQAVVALLEDSVRWAVDDPAPAATSRTAEGPDTARLDSRALGLRPQGPLMAAPGMTVAAQAVGDAIRKVHARDGEALTTHGAEFTCSFLFGGQIKGGPLRLFQIYAAGNHIETSEDTPFFQIGETKYGKPILDRVITAATPLAEAAKCALVSFDSTMRSNLSVGPPIDIAVYRRDSLAAPVRRRLSAEDPYLLALRDQWGSGVRRIFQDLPDPPFAEALNDGGQ